MFLFRIDLTLTVNIVTENGRHIGLDRENVILDHSFESQQTYFLKKKIDINTAKYQMDL